MQRIGIALMVCALGGCGSATTTEPDAPAQPAPSPTATLPASGAAGAAALPANVPAATPTVATTPNPATTPAPSTTPAPTPTTATPATPPPTTQDPTMMPAPGSTLAMDECGLHTKFDGDQYCINPPPTDKGFQAHWGPSNYDNPEPQYVMQPGEENVVTMTVTSGNTTDIDYYYRQYRMRPGSHHVIFTTNGRRLGGTQNLAKDNPEGGVIPPENMDVGLPLAAHSPIDANMHFYNFGEKPIIREVWVNFWYKDKSQVKEPANEVFSMTSVSAAVAHSHVVIGASCPITGSGRLLSIYGHRHMNNVRFSIWHTAAGKKDLIFEDYDPLHPAAFDYNSLTTNPMVDPTTKTAGATTGILNLKQGDTLDFECEIVNMTDKNFTGANEANDDEMCIMVGDAVGATVSPLCTPAASKRIQ